MALGDMIMITRVGQGATGGEELINTFTYANTAGVGVNPTNPELADIASQWNLAVEPAILNCQTADYVHVRVNVKVITGASAGMAIDDFSLAGTTGGAAGAGEVIERALVVKKRSATSTRHGRGRIFMAFPPIGTFDIDGRLVAAPAGAGTMLSNLQGTITVVATGNDWNPVIWHRGTAIYQTILVHQIGNLVGTQRRRRFGIGA